jgi:hypothetical protein
VVLAVVEVLKGLQLGRLLELAPQDKVLLEALALRQQTAAVVAAVLAALVLLVQIGHHEDLPELGLVMVDWADKAQSTALQRLMAAAVGLE